MDSSGIIGAVSLGMQTAQLFGTCLQKYENLLEAFDMESDLSVMRCRLEIEMQRFRLWGDVAKVSQSNNVGVPVGQAQTVLSALRCIEDIFAGRDPIIKRYEEGPSNQTPGTQVEPESTAFGVLVRRARWVLSDKKRLESTVHDIKAINDSLFSLLNEANQRQATQAFQELAIHVLGTENRSRIEALAASTAGSYADIHALASLKALKLAGDGTKTTENTPLPSLPTGLDSLKPHQKWLDLPLGGLDAWGREVRMLDREPVVLEWRRLPKDAKKKSLAISKVRWLVPFLSQAAEIPDLRALDFAGTTLDLSTEYMATVFKYPQTGSSLGMEPTSLHQILGASERSKYLPSLNTRFALAVSLSKAVLQLHTCGWLHKSISSGNILFFYPETSDGGKKQASAAEADLESPYLQGYGYARVESAGRTDADAAFSETVSTHRAAAHYRHPNTFESGERRTKFKKIYDIYSLGVVLLEIGLWTTCSPPASDFSTPQTVRQTLIDKYLNGYLAYRMGTTFQDVVRTCLLGSFGQPGKAKNWLELEFMKRVVRRLEECRM
ncbi:hypothetical protein QBC34DRAFT_437583 [Podospora aff. communis PSN243]|uniref:Protein kinase domain-containing protein n=1 Tax=Podospora aff. communis PSN243 TaxID=3040156 RepID=A0AAV9GQ63_9PEZI|nr:hypothetical protein QBC34DRAFT_437583 [Podospora aff. communis PSN243]